MLNIRNICLLLMSYDTTQFSLHHTEVTEPIVWLCGG